MNEFVIDNGAGERKGKDQGSVSEKVDIFFFFLQKIKENTLKEITSETFRS